MRYDGVVKHRMVWGILNKKELCTVLLTDHMLYLLVTGRMGAVINLEIGVLGDISQKQYQIELQKNEEKISPISADELARKKGSVAIPRQDIESVDAHFPNRLEERIHVDPSVGPIIKIRTKRGKYRLVFRSLTEEDVSPFIDALMQPFMESL